MDETFSNQGIDHFKQFNKIDWWFNTATHFAKHTSLWISHFLSKNFSKNNVFGLVHAMWCIPCMYPLFQSLNFFHYGCVLSKIYFKSSLSIFHLPLYFLPCPACFFMFFLKIIFCFFFLVLFQLLRISIFVKFLCKCSLFSVVLIIFLMFYMCNINDFC